MFKVCNTLVVLVIAYMSRLGVSKVFTVVPTFQSEVSMAAKTPHDVFMLRISVLNSNFAPDKLFICFVFLR